MSVLSGTLQGPAVWHRQAVLNHEGCLGEHVVGHMSTTSNNFTFRTRATFSNRRSLHLRGSSPGNRLYGTSAVSIETGEVGLIQWEALLQILRLKDRPGMGRKRHSLLVLPCVLLCVAVLASRSRGASLTVVKSINDIWGDVAMQAAEVRAGRRVLLAPFNSGLRSLLQSHLARVMMPCRVQLLIASLACMLVHWPSRAMLSHHKCCFCSSTAAAATVAVVHMSVAVTVFQVCLIALAPWFCHAGHAQGHPEADWAQGAQLEGCAHGQLPGEATAEACCKKHCGVTSYVQQLTANHVNVAITHCVVVAHAAATSSCIESKLARIPVTLLWATQA